MNFLSEADVQNLVKRNHSIQKDLLDTLSIDINPLFIAEDKYINGITADFSIIDTNTNSINAIMECKSGNINVTDYVRGIGQLFQYEYFYEKLIPHKSYKYSNDFKTIYLFPSSVIKNNYFNIARFKYPSTLNIIELNEETNAVRLINNDLLTQLEIAENDNLVTISPYYIRDNRIFELYILLNYLFLKKQHGYTFVDRKSAENQFLKKIDTINNGNWRNAFISLSSLGLINKKSNLPTNAGEKLAYKTYAEFAIKMYHSYLYPYFDELLECFNEKNVITATNQDFRNIITNKYKKRDVLFLTESKGRYISSWLNIFRDDYGIIQFKSRNSRRELVYNPSDLNDVAFTKQIKKNSIAEKYIDRYHKLIREEVI